MAMSFSPGKNCFIFTMVSLVNSIVENNITQVGGGEGFTGHSGFFSTKEEARVTKERKLVRETERQK